MKVLKNPSYSHNLEILHHQIWSLCGSLI